MSKIFISYAREDQAQAERLHQSLKSNGFDTWIDKEALLPGQDWSVEIQRAIRTSQYVILLLSKRSMTKRGFIHREIREALDVVREMPESEIFLIPARLEPCEVTHEDLRRLQWVDLFPDWEQGLTYITRSLKRTRFNEVASPERLLPFGNLRLSLREIQEAFGFTKVDLQRALGIDARTIDKLINDSKGASWRLDRDSLSRYVLFAYEHGFEPFRLERHAIWKTFEHSEVSIFRGLDRSSDILVENLLVQCFQRLNCEVVVKPAGASNRLEEDMRERNCVIIGSPKANPASEAALALLWGAEPFNAEQENRRQIPISFLGMATEHPSALLIESSRHGFLIQPPDFKERNFLGVDWLPPEEFGPYQGIGQDAAILVACHRPMNSPRDVTTIVIAGYTGLATLVAAQEVTTKTIPGIKPEENSGTPCLAALKFLYKKRPRYRSSLDGLRSLEESSPKWAPPWDNFFYPINRRYQRL